ncbi:hypothetical protein [Rhodococcus erythropolis]|uniref:hypothetical protein n=1 Tax=Rhodococcus erythropolis TaxID=1833 RepID=UPI00366D0981
MHIQFGKGRAAAMLSMSWLVLVADRVVRADTVVATVSLAGTLPSLLTPNLGGTLVETLTAASTYNFILTVSDGGVPDVTSRSLSPSTNPEPDHCSRIRQRVRPMVRPAVDPRAQDGIGVSAPLDPSLKTPSSTPDPALAANRVTAVWGGAALLQSDRAAREKVRYR